MGVVPIAPASAADVVVVGDSIGLGIATAAGIKGQARPSASLRRGNLAAEFAKVPVGTVVLLSLGLNDAGYPLPVLITSIDKVIEAISREGRRVVWLGLPCTFTKWEVRARALDVYLEQRLARTSIQYVSLRDDWICNPQNRTRDGVHFHHKGYLYMWQKVRRQASFLAEVEVARCPAPGGAAAKGLPPAGQACVRRASRPL